MEGPGDGAATDSYRGIDKHKRPWKVAVSGSQCEAADGSVLFAEAVAHPSKPGQRFATDGRRWFRALTGEGRNDQGGQLWHGHPVEPQDVPAAVQQVFVERGVLRRVHPKKVMSA